MCRTFQFQIFLTWECQLCIVCVATVRGFAFFAVLLSLTWLQVLWFVRTLYSGVFPLDKPAEFITVFSLRKVREEKHNSFMGNYFTNMRSDSNGEVVKRLFPYITENLLPTRKMKFAQHQCQCPVERVIKSVKHGWVCVTPWSLTRDVRNRSPKARGFWLTRQRSSGNQNKIEFKGVLTLPRIGQFCIGDDPLVTGKSLKKF